MNDNALSTNNNNNHDNDEFSTASFAECAALTRARQTQEIVLDVALLRASRVADPSQLLRHTLRDMDITTLMWKDIPLTKSCMQSLKNYIRAHGKLESLVLGGPSLTLADAQDFIQSLYRNQTLRNLVFYRLQGLAQCQQALRDLLRRNKALKIIFFSCIHWTNVDFLAQGLARNTTLLALSLDRCNLSPQQFRLIVQAISSRPCQVSLLYVQKNRNLGCQSLQIALEATQQPHCQLVGLAFPGCPDLLTNPQAVQYLVQFLTTNTRHTTKLRSLDIPHCPMNNGHEAVFVALETNTFLESLVIDVPHPLALSQLVQSLPKFKTLKTLRIAGIYPHLDVTLLEQGLRQNTSLYHFLHSNDITPSPDQKISMQFFGQRNRFLALPRPVSRGLWSVVLQTKTSTTSRNPRVGLSLMYYLLRNELMDIVPRRINRRRKRAKRS